jgi:hypothetical protein
MSHNVPLTSAELSNLWTQYVNDSLSLCMLRHFLEHVKDKDIRDILIFARKLAQGHIDKIETFYKAENLPEPKGFTEEDVKEDAPPLFSDVFMLVYMHIMTIHGLTGYAGAVSTSIRSDQVNYFIQCNHETLELHRRITETMLYKGIISKPPNIQTPKQVDFVKKQSYLTGWFGERRPLNSVELNGTFFNMKKTVVKITLEQAFSKVASSKEVRDYFKRGEKLCDNQFKKLGSILSKEKYSSPKRIDSEVLETEISPFSDKLMLYHVVTLVSTAVGYYGAAFSLSQRRDLSIKYALLIADIAKYAEDGVNILINNGWYEQPPMPK